MKDKRTSRFFYIISTVVSKDDIENMEKDAFVASPLGTMFSVVLKPRNNVRSGLNGDVAHAIKVRVRVIPFDIFDRRVHHRVK